jgi:hypothetical protein
MDPQPSPLTGSIVQGRQVKSCHLAGGNPAWKDSSQVTNSESWSGKGNLAV